MLPILLVGCESSSGPRQSQFRTLGLERLDGYVELLADIREETSEGESGRRSGTEALIEEAVALAVTGFAYHPNLVHFRLKTRTGLVERSFRESFENIGYAAFSFDNSEFELEPVVEYDLEADILRTQKYPGRIFARSERALESRLFRSSVEVLTSAFGLDWRYLEDPFSAGVSMTYKDVELDPLGEGRSESQEMFNLRFDAAYRFSRDHDLKADFEHRFQQESVGQLDLTANEASIRHTWRFGAERRGRLLSQLNWLDQNGSLAVDRVWLRELFDLQITDDLNSSISLTLQDQEQTTNLDTPAVSETTYDLGASLTHQLYRSITTHLRADYSMQDLGGEGEREFTRAVAGFDYSKETSIGRLGMGYQAQAGREENRLGGDLVMVVLDEAITFTGPLPVPLSSPNVDESSIFVTATDGLTVYFRGVDYDVIQIGDRTEIERLPTGGIAPGETVLVDYSYTRFGRYELDTWNHRFTFRHEFPFGLSLYYRFLFQDQELEPQTAQGVTTDDIKNHTTGLEFREGNFDFRAEYEDEDSTIDDLRAFRLGAGISRPLADGDLSLRIARDDVWRRVTDVRRTTLFSASAAYRGRLSDRLSFDGAVYYRDGDDTVVGQEQTVELDARLHWIYGRLNVKLIGNYIFSDVRDSDRQQWRMALQTQLRF